MKKFFLLLLPLLINACGDSNPKTNSEVKNAATFPQYGNYCGLDRPAEGQTPKPVDEVDSACKNHDQCYKDRGNFNTVCDMTLIAELKNIMPKTESEQVARKLIISYFRNSPQKAAMEINLDKME